MTSPNFSITHNMSTFGVKSKTIYHPRNSRRQLLTVVGDIKRSTVYNQRYYSKYKREI